MTETTFERIAREEIERGYPSKPLRAASTIGRAAALSTLRDLIRQGFAGLDQYDDTRFVVDAPQAFLEEAEVALDALGAHFLKTAPPGVTPNHVSVLLPSRARDELGLDAADAPRLNVPLASRRVVD